MSDYQDPGNHEEATEALCKAMGDDWEWAQMPGGFAPWYRKLADVVLNAEVTRGGGAPTGISPSPCPTTSPTLP